jgi:hypothetical protein
MLVKLAMCCRGDCTGTAAIVFWGSAPGRSRTGALQQSASPGRRRRQRDLHYTTHSTCYSMPYDGSIILDSSATMAAAEAVDRRSAVVGHRVDAPSRP